MSSSLQRSRSLRKPAATATTTSTSADLTARRQDTEPRHSSPSRLPVKPLTRSATAATASTRTLRSGSTPSSGLARSTSVRQPATSKEPPRREASRYPPSTTTTRPRPAVRPTSSDGPSAPTKRITSHVRAKSTTTPTPATAVSNLRGASILRPSSGGSTSSASKLRATPALRPPSGGSTSSASSTTTRTTTRTVHTRKVSGHEKPTAASAASAAAAPTQAQPRLRPAFSTLQQHYSPAKSAAPKPLTSTFLAPPSPSKLPANVAASAETSRLQAELLQLHLLHQDAAVVDAEWRSSARQKLGARFAQVSADGTQVDEREKAEIERENVLALRSWAVGGGLEDRIQTLDAVINGVWTLGEPGGRYARVIRRFERWVDRMCEIEDVRRGDGALLQEQDVLFISELDAAWKDECMGLIRRLDGMKRQLQELGQLPDEANEERSSLRRMMENSRTLIEGMLAELSLMEDIEREALAREDDWIEKMNRDEDADDTPRAGAVWRVV